MFKEFETILFNFVNSEILFFKENISLELFLSLSSIFVILFIFKFLKKSYFFFSFFSLFSTIMHEAMHFLVSLFMNGQPSKFSVLPRKTENGYILGYVESRNVTWYNGFFIGLAPFLLLPLAYLFLKNDLIYEKDLIFILLKSYIVASLIEGSIPSITDFLLVIKKSFILFLILFFIIFLKF